MLLTVICIIDILFVFYFKNRGKIKKEIDCKYLGIDMDIICVTIIFLFQKYQ